MGYEILPYTFKKAKQLGVHVVPSKFAKYKIDKVIMDFQAETLGIAIIRITLKHTTKNTPMNEGDFITLDTKERHYEEN